MRRGTTRQRGGRPAAMPCAQQASRRRSSRRLGRGTGSVQCRPRKAPQAGAGPGRPPGRLRTAVGGVDRWRSRRPRPVRAEGRGGDVRACKCRAVTGERAQHDNCRDDHEHRLGSGEDSDEEERRGDRQPILQGTGLGEQSLLHDAGPTRHDSRGRDGGGQPAKAQSRRLDGRCERLGQESVPASQAHEDQNLAHCQRHGDCGDGGIENWLGLCLRPRPGRRSDPDRRLGLNRGAGQIADDRLTLRHQAGEQRLPRGQHRNSGPQLRFRELLIAFRVALATLASALVIACWLDWSWRSTELRRSAASCALTALICTTNASATAFARRWERPGLPASEVTRTRFWSPTVPTEIAAARPWPPLGSPRAALASTVGESATCAY